MAKCRDEKVEESTKVCLKCFVRKIKDRGFVWKAKF